MTKTDIAALELAIERARAHGPLHAQQIDGMLVDQLWEEVGRFASYSCQCSVLQLAPWQSPPCEMSTDYNPVDDPDPGQVPARGCAAASRDARSRNFALASRSARGARGSQRAKGRDVSAEWLLH